MRVAPLNVFQKTQRLWETLHPYNAAQAAVLARSFSTTTLEDAFNRALADLRLGIFVCAGENYWIDRSDSRSARVVEIADLERHLGIEMNRAFDPRVSMPLRPFVRNGTSEQTIGIVYQHWVADSVSIRMVMRAWLSRLLDRPDLRPPPAMLDRVGLAGRFGPGCAGWSVVAQLMELYSFARAMKRMRRVDPLNGDQRVGVVVRSLDADLIDGVRSRAKGDGATVGDIFLAAAAQACAAHGPAIASRRRPDLAMGTIVDLRARAAHLPSNLFGLFLGFLVSPFRAGDLDRFDVLVKRASALRLMQARKRSAEASQLRMWVGLQFARWLTTENLLHFYRKRFPLSGGISNVNLSPEWIGSLHPQIVLRYHRISPIGPLLPIVLTPTTLGGQFSLCATWRAGLLGDDRAERIIDGFIHQLKCYATAH